MFFDEFDQLESTESTELDHHDPSPTIWMPLPQNYNPPGRNPRAQRQRAQRNRAAQGQPPSDAQLRYLLILSRHIHELHSQIEPIQRELGEIPMSVQQAAGINPSATEVWPGLAAWVKIADRRAVSDLIDQLIHREYECRRILRSLRARSNRRLRQLQQ